VDVVRRNQPLLATPVAVLALLVAGAAPASAAPTCEEGPQTEGSTIVGTPCADTIRAPRSVTTVYGEGGDDVLYGQRGNDTLYGGEGNDRLYGGVGDDRVRGGNGDDLLSGGFGADSLDGEAGSDYARGDATIDAIGDSGISGEDTLSFATGVTPGFPNEGGVVAYTGFPDSGGERGVYVDLTQDFANDGSAPDGGGFDEPLGAANFESFERVVGTPFSDLIVGGPGAETISGGGGADVILGGGGADQIFGGADGDYCDGSGATTFSCEFSGGEKEVSPRNASAVVVGSLAAPGGGPPALYLAGSNAVDRVSATYEDHPPRVTFKLLAGSAAAFDTSAPAAGGCNPPAGGEVVCPLTEAPDSIVLAGLGGDDSFSAAGFPATTSIVMLGGEAGDELVGTEAEDVLIDGPGDDAVAAGAGDDAVPNNQGADSLSAGAGDDLFISDSVCEGDSLDGGEGRDNANWANFDSPIAIDMAAGIAGLLGGGGVPDCSGDPPTTLHAIEDTEGTNLGDTMVGDAGPNQLLGRQGSDSYFAGGGDDSILANSGTPTPDPDPVIDCGEGWDTAQIDFPENGPDAAPVGCEEVEERAPNSFRPPGTPPNPNPPPAPIAKASSTLPRVRPDRRAPQTVFLHRPPRVVFTTAKRRRVAVSFASNEAGAMFKCKLDGRPFKPCRSPRAYMVRRGRHTIRVYAIDAAGNRDRTPVALSFRVRRR
jgi:Ca2+-binding RTX toxin-like protein